MNSYVCFKWALTEDNPTIKPYDQKAWAKLPDSQKTTVEDSLAFIDILHKRWSLLLRSLGDEDLKKEFFHPESGPTTLVKPWGYMPGTEITIWRILLRFASG